MAYALAGGNLDRDIPKAWVDADRECNFGCVIGAIDISKFTDVETFCRKADELLEWVKTGHASPEMNEILVPGERAHQKYLESKKNGIEVTEKIDAELNQLLVKYHVVVDMDTIDEQKELQHET